MSRRLGGGGDGSVAGGVGSDDMRDQYQLRELAASLLGRIARAYARSNTLLRPKLTRTCLKAFLDPSKSAPVLYGAIAGLSAAGGPEAVRVLVLPNLRHFDAAILQPLRDRTSATDFEMLVTGGIVKAIRTIVPRPADASSTAAVPNGLANGSGSTEAETAELVDFLGPIVGSKVAQLGDHALNQAVLDARNIE